MGGAGGPRRTWFDGTGGADTGAGTGPGGGDAIWEEDAGGRLGTGGGAIGTAGALAATEETSGVAGTGVAIGRRREAREADRASSSGVRPCFTHPSRVKRSSSASALERPAKKTEVATTAAPQPGRALASPGPFLRFPFMPPTRYYGIYHFSLISSRFRRFTPCLRLLARRIPVRSPAGIDFRGSG